MLEYYEVSPLPKCCTNCTEDDCYNCDHTLERWHLTPDSELELEKLRFDYAKRRLAKRERELGLA